MFASRSSSRAERRACFSRLLGRGRMSIPNFFTACQELIVQSVDRARLIGRDVLQMQCSQLILGRLEIATMVAMVRCEEVGRPLPWLQAQWDYQAQSSSPPTVRKPEWRFVIYQLSLRVSVPRGRANDGAENRQARSSFEIDFVTVLIQQRYVMELSLRGAGLRNSSLIS
jgi:hypothetical protein